VLLRGKQTVNVPLLLEVLPTQQQFREAVSSLSEDQRAFAAHFRSMQMSMTGFVVVVVHIKPQLERM
jgi:hypothetical protein